MLMLDGSTQELHCTEWIQDTLDPVWDEDFEFIVDFRVPASEAADPVALVFTIFDHDEGILDSDDDFLGQAILFISSLRSDARNAAGVAKRHNEHATNNGSMEFL